MQSDAVPHLCFQSRRALWLRVVAQDPFLAAVFLEDFAATVGVCIAAAGIALTQVTGLVVFDTVASLSIGGLLGFTALRLVQLNKKFLLGQAVDDATIKDITGIIRSRPAIDSISEVQSQWIGPTMFSYKAEVDFDGTYLAARLHRRCVAVVAAVFFPVLFLVPW